MTQSREEIIADLREILFQHVRDFHHPWPGAEFGKTLIGNAILGALADHGCDRKVELQRAVSRARPPR